MFIEGMQANNAGFEALTAVAIESTVCCEVTPCSPVEIQPNFGGTVVIL
jgi:hypothetical protein